MSVVGLELQWTSPNGDSGDAVLERLTVGFERLGEDLGDFQRFVWPHVTEALETESKGQFDVEGGGPSGSWAQLSPAYAAWKEQNYPGQTILRRTDKLFEALTQSSSPFARRETTSDTFNFGTQGVEYASHHQVGTDVLVPRPLFDFGTEFEAALVRAGALGAREAITHSGVEEFVEVTP